MKTQKKSVKSKVAICKSIASDRDGAKKKSRKIKVAIASIAASTALLLGGGFALSTAIQSKNHSDGNKIVVQEDSNRGNQFEHLAEKYIEYFVKNPNNTVKLDLSKENTRDIKNKIDDSDRAQLEQYSQMLDSINEFVANGIMYIAEDGNYYMTSNTKANRNTNGGKTDFYITTKKILFIPIPTGYCLDLPLIVVYFIDVVMKAQNEKEVWKNSILNGLSDFTNLLQSLYPFANANGYAQIEQLYNVVREVLIGGKALYSAVSSVFGSGVASVLDSILGKLIDWLSSSIYDKFIHPMYGEYEKHHYNDDKINTVEMTCNLLFFDVRISSFVA